MSRRGRRGGGGGVLDRGRRGRFDGSLQNTVFVIFAYRRIFLDFCLFGLWMEGMAEAEHLMSIRLDFFSRIHTITTTMMGSTYNLFFFSWNWGHTWDGKGWIGWGAVLRNIV